MQESEFNALAEACLPRLRNVVRKQVGHQEQTNDIVQDALVKAWVNRDTFKGDSVFCTWLCSIAIRTAIDYLREQTRWRDRSQVIYAYHCMNIPEWGMEVGQAMANPEIEYDANEHIAYCFSCVGRTLDPLDQAALILKEVLNLTSMEAGKVLGITESVFRQHLTRARSVMQDKYEHLCALVNKNGVCYQCKGLRDGFPDDRKGHWRDEMDTGLAFDLRMQLVRDANIDNGKSQIMHEVFWKRTFEQEDNAMGDETVVTDCGHD